MERNNSVGSGFLVVMPVGSRSSALQVFAQAARTRDIAFLDGLRCSYQAHSVFFMKITATRDMKGLATVADRHDHLARNSPAWFGVV